MKTQNLMPAMLGIGVYWAIELQEGRQWQSRLESMTMGAHMAEVLEAKSRALENDAKDKPFDVSGGIAIISIVGPMTKSTGNSFSNTTSTVEARRQIRAAANDPDVKGILLRIDSPGGSVAGTQTLADDVAAADRKKPVVAYAEDLMCSAAFWVGSQARAIYANETALVGSIGTYMVAYDASRMFENAGIKTHVVSTGKLKGGGADGAPISEEQLEAWQTTVDGLNAQFLSAVAKGRSMPIHRVEDIADGDVHLASKALSLGLIDGISSMDDVLSSMRSQKGVSPVGASVELTIPATMLQLQPQEEAESNNLTPAAPLIGVSLENALDSVLIAARGATEAVQSVSGRVAQVKDLRASQHRTFSRERLEQVRTASAALAESSEEFTALLASCEALAVDPVATSPGPSKADLDAAFTRTALDSAFEIAAS